jgi:iron complex transport system substrate-binding protein
MRAHTGNATRPLRARPIRRVGRWVSPVVVTVTLAGCGAAVPPAASIVDAGTVDPGRNTIDDRPGRVISLDYCADQFALKFLDPTQILALSPDAVADYSYMRRAAAGLPTVRPRMEDVLVRGPDLVIRSYGGGPNATALLRSAGIDVVQVGYGGDLEGVRRNILSVAGQLGATAEGEAVVAEMDRRLAAVRARTTQRAGPAMQALYLTPAGVTAGESTLIDVLFDAAGLENYQRSPGWQPIPLERLAYRRPDVVVPGFFGSSASRMNAWTSIHHPVVRRQMDALPRLPIEGAWTSCAGWFLVDAVEALAGVPLPPRTAHRADD